LESSYIQTSTVHKLLEVIHEESCAKIKSIELVPVQPLGQAWCSDAPQCPTDKH